VVSRSSRVEQLFDRWQAAEGPVNLLREARMQPPYHGPRQNTGAFYTGKARLDH
jgi:hypothetical protein